MNKFYQRLLTEIIISLNNNFFDNFDYYRFPKKKINLTGSYKKKVNTILDYLFGYKIVSSQYNFVINKKMTPIVPYLEGLDRFYNTLGDERSKELLVKVIAYRILGHKKIKLPLNTSSFWAGILKISKAKSNKYLILPHGRNNSIKLYKYHLDQFNIPITLYLHPQGIYENLYIKQYDYKTQDCSIRPEVGDVVLDCGAYCGDSALFFSHSIGNNGHVYSFEFIPNNIRVFLKNIELNPELSERITLIKRPLLNKSKQYMYYEDMGAGSILTNQQTGTSKTIKSISIDDFCFQNEITKVDFIKMDIEGSELSALKGGIETLRKHKPKLAISIYHSMDDFVNIPIYLKSLELGYNFYLNHGTIHAEETVLLAC